MLTIIVSNGADHIELSSIDTKSKRFTSFDNKLTTFPGDVSPNAVWDNLSAWKPQKPSHFVKSPHLFQFTAENLITLR